MRTRHFSLLALVAGLGVSIDTLATPVPGLCPSSSGQDQTSAVIGASEQLGGGDWQYRYRVCNTSQFDPYYAGNFVVIDWELPYFDDAQISNIVTPFGWSYSIEDVGVANPSTGWGMQDNNNDGFIDDLDAVPQWTVDGDYWKDVFDTAYGGATNNPFNTVDKVLHFYWSGQLQFATSAVGGDQQFFCDRIFEGQECEGFGFDSPFSAGDAPYQTSWEFLPVNTGDPLFPLGGNGGGIPNSPSVRGTQVVPEPFTLALLGLALPMLGRRRPR